MNLNETIIIDPSYASFTVMDESNEAKSEVDGKHILARVRGVGFRANSASRNKRFYSHELWEKAIERNKTRLKERKILGYLGHGTDNSDEGIANAALVITKMELPPNESGKELDGVIEYLVLGTPTGHSLNTMLRAGVTLGVSSRASGTEESKDVQGNSILSAETYNLNGFDIVQNTGVQGAIPNLIESEALNQNKETGADAPHEGVSPVSDITIKREQYEKMVQDIASLEAKLETAISVTTTNESVITEAQATELKEAVADKDKASEQVAVYEALGTPEQLETLLEALEAYVELGPIDKVESCLAVLEEYVEAGSVEEFAVVSKSHVNYEALGTVEQLEALLDTLEEYVELGSVEAVTEMKEASSEKSKKAEAVAFAEEHKCALELAESLLSKVGKEDAAEIIATLPSKGRISEAYRPIAKDLIEGADEAEGKQESHKVESLASSII